MRVTVTIDLPDDAMAEGKAETVASLDEALPQLRAAIKGAAHGGEVAFDVGGLHFELSQSDG